MQYQRLTDLIRTDLFGQQIIMRPRIELKISVAPCALFDKSERRKVIRINAQRAVNADLFQIMLNLTPKSVISNRRDQARMAAQFGQGGGDVRRSPSRRSRVLAGGHQACPALSRDKIDQCFTDAQNVHTCNGSLNHPTCSLSPKYTASEQKGAVMSFEAKHGHHSRAPLYYRAGETRWAQGDESAAANY